MYELRWAGALVLIDFHELLGLLDRLLRATDQRFAGKRRRQRLKVVSAPGQLGGSSALGQQSLRIPRKSRGYGLERRLGVVPEFFELAAAGDGQRQIAGVDRARNADLQGANGARVGSERAHHPSRDQEPERTGGLTL